MRASAQALPAPVLLLHEAIVDPPITSEPRWCAAWDALTSATYAS